MRTAGRNEDWTGPQLAAGLAALDGAVPDPVAYLICRQTTASDGTETLVFHAEETAGALPQQELPAWLARRGLRGADRLGLAILVIRETVDADGLIRTCILEHRRGAVDGPLVGDPARIEFTGPVRTIRFYRMQPDGKLAETIPMIQASPPAAQPPEQLGSEVAAVRARFGPGLRVLDVREPTVLEAMAGCDRILHAGFADRREIGCGIGWHGPVPFVLAAAFPRFAPPLLLAPDEEAAVQALLRQEDLVRHETRADQAGLAVIARRRGTSALLLIRIEGGRARPEPYQPAPFADGTTDQLRWMRYAETYEHLAILDAWPDGDTASLIVVTGEASAQIWRHGVDRDGVEVWRKPDDEAAAGFLYRERLAEATAPGISVAHGSDATASDGSRAAVLDTRDATASLPQDAAATPVPSVAAEPQAPPSGIGAPARMGPPAGMRPPDPLARPAPQVFEGPEPPAGSLLGKAEAYVTAIAALHDAQASAGPCHGAEVMDQVRLLLAALDRLSAETAAAETRLLLSRMEDGLLQPAELTGALALIAARLPEELAARQVVLLPPLASRRMREAAPFGRVVEDAFPEAAYDCEEAALCLAFGRPTAAAFHAMRAVAAGLATLCPALASSLSGEGRSWPQILAALRSATGTPDAAVMRTLETVRRCCRAPRLAPAAKYTEAEAERLFQAAGAFLTAAAETIGGGLP